MEATLAIISDERKSHDILKDRFNILDDNHNEMIKLKDGYKADNEKLRNENTKLNQQNNDIFSAPLNERNSTIERLHSEIAVFQQNLNEAEQKER